jgi:hypothetical protein
MISFCALMLVQVSTLNLAWFRKFFLFITVPAGSLVEDPAASWHSAAQGPVPETLLRQKFYYV